MKLVEFEQRCITGDVTDKQYRTRKVFINPANVTFILEQTDGYCEICNTGGMGQWIQIKEDITVVADKLELGMR